jgi:heme-degrading monooxygenase HmoA
MMPALPWTAVRTPDPDSTYLGFATGLPLTRYRHVPGFLRDTTKIRHQLAGASGLVGYSLLAELRAKTFWTVSVWDDDAAMRAFAGTDPHRSIIRRVPDRMGASAFRTFAVAGRELPLTWPAAKDRLA